MLSRWFPGNQKPRNPETRNFEQSHYESRIYEFTVPKQPNPSADSLEGKRTKPKRSMPIRNIDGVIKHLEDNASDELAHLESVGPEFFTTEQLLRLRGQWEVKNHLFRAFQQLVVRIAAISPVWVAGYFLFTLLKLRYLALLSLALFPLSFVVFFAGLAFIFKYFKGKGHLDRVGEMIAEELNRRKEAGKRE